MECRKVHSYKKEKKRTLVNVLIIKKILLSTPLPHITSRSRTERFVPTKKKKKKNVSKRSNNNKTNIINPFLTLPQGAVPKGSFLQKRKKKER
jgi:hypothetical protein